MSWILAGIYCLLLWLVFDKLKLLRMSLPLAVIFASIGPSLIWILLFCAQYFHPYSADARVFQTIIPITAQLNEPGRVTEIFFEPNSPIKSGEPLFAVDKTPYVNEVGRLKANLEQAQQSNNIAREAVNAAQANFNAAKSNLEFATNERDREKTLFESNSISAEQYEESVNSFNAASAALAQAQSGIAQANLTIIQSGAQADAIAKQLEDAQYDLEQTTTTAPTDGYVINLQLRKGMLVGGSGSSAVMSFVADQDEHQKGIVVAAFHQKHYLLIKEGQYVEAAIYGYPGRIFSGKVISMIDANGAGQLAVSGEIPEDLGSRDEAKFAVRIKLDEGDNLRLPAGSQAYVAVYTENLQFAGIPVMFLIRTKSWLNYIF